MRKAVQAAARNRSRSYSFIPPIRGLVLTELANARPGGALVLENWYPTRSGIRARAGSAKYATIGTDPVLSMWTYKSGAAETFFAADAGSIFDVTTIVDPDVAPAAAWTGQTSGYYSVAQIGTAGDDYLYAVNGTDAALLYDGTNFYPITDEEIYGLAYDAETGAFTAGETVTGGTSGATAEIVRVIDNGLTGTLWVRGITSGPFQDNEALTDGDTGAATANIPSGVTDVQDVTITGVDTSTFSHVSLYNSRLYLVQKDTMNIAYLGVDSIGGAASTFSLSGVFQEGGAVLFTAKWSLDSGDGLDDKFVVVSNQGEIAVYQGLYPGDASWSKVGVYNIAKAMGINSTMVAGGDLLIATKGGIIPISEAVSKDMAALTLAAVTREIEPDWRREVTRRGTQPWEIMKWPSKGMAVVSLPVVDEGIPAKCYVANLETGAWTVYTGWETRSLCHYAGGGYFGNNSGIIYRMEQGGSDDGSPYVCAYAGLPDHIKSVGEFKVFHSARGVFKSNIPFKPKVSASVNYSVSFPTAPSAAPDTGSSLWDVGLWDVAVWDAGSAQQVSTKWFSIGRSGFSFMPQLQVTLGNVLAPQIELLATDVIYEAGEFMI